MSMFPLSPPLSGRGKRQRSVSSSFLPGALLLVLCAFSLLTCSKAPPVSRNLPSFEIHAQRWPEAEALFKRDRYWLGGDGAYSIDLGAGRVLWLFGDSFIGDGSSRGRKDAVVVRNTIAIQKGYDPAASSADFSWKTVRGKPEAFFPSQQRFWYWPGSGIRISDRVLIFLMEVEPSGNRLGFAPRGWDAMLVTNPDEDPERWKVIDLKVPETRFGVIVGSACCTVRDGFLYAFGADADRRGAFLVRWKLSDAAQGNLANIEWWTKGGWLAQDRLARKPAPLFPDAQMEYTVHYEKTLDKFIEVQTGSFLDYCLVYRSSKSLTGPWSGETRFSCPQDIRVKGLLVYAGKAHPGLAGADLVCTYATNSLDGETLLTDNSLYYPVFVKASFTLREQ